MKKNTILSILIILIACAIIALTYFIKTRSNVITTSNDEITKSNFAIGLKSANKEIENLTFNYDGNGDWTGVVEIDNSNDVNKDCSLAMFVNYESIPFQADTGSNSKLYKFSMLPNSTKDIKVTISKDYIKYKENFIFINMNSDVDKSADDYKRIIRFNRIGTTYCMLNTASNLTMPTQSFENIDSANLCDAQKMKGYNIIINQNTSDKNNTDLLPNEIKTTPNKTLDFGLRTGGINTDDYLVMINLNNEPVNINGKPYLELKMPSAQFAFTKISLQAPQQKGKYELQAILIPKPWQKYDKDGNGIELSKHSTRITLNVE